MVTSAVPTVTIVLLPIHVNDCVTPEHTETLLVTVVGRGDGILTNASLVVTGYPSPPTYSVSP